MQVLGKLKIDVEKKALFNSILKAFFGENSTVFIIFKQSAFRIYLLTEKYSFLFKNGAPIEIAIDKMIIREICHFSQTTISDKKIIFPDDIETYIDFSCKEGVILISLLNTNTGILMLSSFESRYLFSFRIEMSNQIGVINIISNYFNNKESCIIMTSVFTNSKSGGTSSLLIDIGTEILLNQPEIEKDLIDLSNSKILSVELQNIIKATIKKENYIPKYGKVFISYSSKDKNFVEILSNRLMNKNIEIWIDEKDIKIGDKIQNEISKGLKTADKYLLICSKNSLKSWWVERELDEALFLESKSTTTKLIPINLDNEIFDDQLEFAKKEYLQTRHIGDFTKWEQSSYFEKALGKLLKACEI